MLPLFKPNKVIQIEVVVPPSLEIRQGRLRSADPVPGLWLTLVTRLQTQPQAERHDASAS
jgi:hypothetical protein